MVSSFWPYGDFLLHMGYRQRGYQVKQLEEPFPDGFEIPKDHCDYQGYLPRSTRGGFVYFFTIGYAKCALTCLRVSLMIIYMYNVTFDFTPLQFRALPLIFMFQYAYASFCFMMLLKWFFENTTLRLPSCNCCERLCKKKARRSEYGRVLGSEVDEEDVII